MATRARARAEQEVENQKEQDSGYLSVVLTNEEKDLVQTIQRRDLAARSRFNWKEAAESVGMREEYSEGSVHAAHASLFQQRSTGEHR